MTDTANRHTIGGRIHETFSQAFQKLVKNDGDIVGMIAYCLYKQQKQEFVERLAKRYRTISRRSPRVEAFHGDFFHDSQINHLRDIADLRLTTYVKAFTDEAKNEAYREIAVDKGRSVTAGQSSDRSKTVSTWIFGVSTSIAAAIILGVFVDLDEHFPSVDPFPDRIDRQVEALPENEPDIFKVEPAAPPRSSNLPVM